MLVLVLLSTFILAFGSYDLYSRAKFPKPSGQYQVGTTLLELVDTARLEPYTHNPADHRRLLVQIYYPASIKENSPTVPYSPSPVAIEEDINSVFRVPKLLIKRLTRTKTGYFDQQHAAPIEKQFPVLFFSHGWDGNRFQNSFMYGELVSHGYIIVSIEHTFNASGTVFRDGNKGGVEPLSKMKDTSFSSAMMETWTKDQQFVLDQLEQLQQGGNYFLADQMNLKQVGVFGHSFGGATSATTLVYDKRFKAGINMDGFYFGNAYKIGFEQPFMQLRSDNKRTEDMSDKELKEFDASREYYQYLIWDEWNKRINAFAKNGYHSFTVKGSNHMSFSDFTYMMPLAFITAPSRDEHHRITNQLVLSFFNRYLKGSKDPVGVEKELERFIND